MASGPTAKSSRRARVLVTIAVLAGVAVFAVILSFLVWRWRLGRDLHAKIAAIKAAGLPVDWQDLSHWPRPIPDNENAAFIYTNAIAHLNTNAIENIIIENITAFENPSQLRQPISAKMRTQFESAVRTNVLALAIINQVTNAEESRYPINYLDGPEAKLLYLPGLRDLARVLECDAILKAEDSNAHSAADDIRSQLNLSRSLDDEPILISQLVSVAILAISCETFQAVLCRTPLSDIELSKLQPQFTAAEATNRILTGLIGDRAIDGECIRLAQDDPQKFSEIGNQASPGDDQSEFPQKTSPGWRLIGFFARDRNFYLDAMATNILLIEHGPPGSLAVAAQSDRLLDRELRDRLCLLSAMFLPPMSAIARHDATCRAELRNAVAAIAVERWRSTHHGALPGSLTNLAPAFLSAVPTDPYDGKPLRYKELTNGYCIYSIGPNLRDDGGKEMPPLKVRETTPGWTNYDIVFRVER